jgi:hypothetical protein
LLFIVILFIIKGSMNINIEGMETSTPSIVKGTQKKSDSTVTVN